MLQETTYNGHTYKIGDLAFFIEDETDNGYCYFGKIKSIVPLKNETGKVKYDNRYTVEVIYAENGHKFSCPISRVTDKCYLKPVKESLDMLIKQRKNEIKSLKEIYKEIE